MVTNNKLNLMSAKQVAQYLAIGESSLYAQIKKGHIPKPFNMLKNTKRWALYEIEQVSQAYIRGATEEELKFLAKEIMESRSQKPF